MPINDQRLTPEQIHHICHELMTPEQAKEFAEIKEMNFARRGEAGPGGGPVGNFRINIFQQRNTVSMVVPGGVVRSADSLVLTEPK